MPAVFQMWGSCEVEMHTLIIRVREAIRMSPSILTYFTLINSRGTVRSELNYLVEHFSCGHWPKLERKA